MKLTVFQIVVVFAALAVSTGCMKVGPDYKRPDIGIDAPKSYQHAPHRTAKSATEERWWQVFGDPELNSLVDQALQHNFDIKKAAARIMEVRSQFVQTRADRFPTVSLKAEGKRQSQAVTTTTTSGGQGTWRRTETDTHSLSLPASFEIDLWGRLARADEAARADLLEAEESRAVMAQTVVAETVSLYLEIESLERRIAVSSERIENLRQGLALVERRYTRGLVSSLDVRQARREFARVEATLPSLRQELGAAQQRLAVLAGRYPTTSPARPHPEDYFKRLAPVPPGLPSSLLLKRPDVRAAEAKLKALNARIGVAKAGRFPSISLTGSFGYSSEDMDRLFRPQSELWNLALGVTQTLFDAGKLEAGQRSAEARYEQGLAEYAKIVLTAFSEVERALLTRKEQLERRKRVVDFLAEARAAHQVAEDRYKRGLVDYLTVLEAERTRFQAEEDLILVDFSILSNRVALHRALGGGWEEFS